MTRDEALNLVREFVKNEGLVRHMLCVEAAMRYYAEKFGEDVETWGLLGLVHDFDWEIHPQAPDHPMLGEPLLKERGVSDVIRRAILSHATYSGVARESLLEEHADGLAAAGGKAQAFTPNSIALYNAFLRYGVVQDEAVHRYISLVGGVLAQVSTRPALPWTFVVLDTGMTELIRPALYGAYHEIANISRWGEPATELANIVGPNCESGDRLGTDRRGHAGRAGDSTYADARRRLPGGKLFHKLLRGREVGLKSGEVAVVDSDQRRLQGQGRVELLGVMDLDQDRHPK